MVQPSVPIELLSGLFALPLDAFVAGRDELAKQLRKQGDAPLAAAVKAMRKPPLWMWAINQLASSDAVGVQRLIELTGRLRELQQSAETGARDEILEVTRDRRRAADALVSSAARVLEGGGHAAARATLDRIGRLLLTATSDETAAAALSSGALVESALAESFGGLDVAPTPRMKAVAAAATDVHPASPAEASAHDERGEESAAPADPMPEEPISAPPEPQVEVKRLGAGDDVVVGAAAALFRRMPDPGLTAQVLAGDTNHVIVALVDGRAEAYALAVELAYPDRDRELLVTASSRSDTEAGRRAEAAVAIYLLTVCRESGWSVVLAANESLETAISAAAGTPARRGLAEWPVPEAAD